MADYIFINDFDKGGSLAISRNVFAKIALESVETSQYKNSVKVTEPIKVIFKKDGKVIISLHVELKKGMKTSEICTILQKEIAHDLDVYVESVPFEILISVDQFK